MNILKMFCLSVFIVASVFLAIAQGFSEAHPSLAVLDVTPVKADASKALIVYNFIIDKVHKSGSFTIVERKEIDRALKEIEFSKSLLVDNKTAIDIGKFTGARFVLISSLSLEDNMYYLSMRIVETGTGKVYETSMKSASDFNKAEDLVAESVKDLLSVKTLAVDQSGTTAKDKTPFSTVGATIGVPIPIADASRFLNVTIEPAVWYGYHFVFDWGIVSVGGGLGFDFFGVKEQPASWVINFPVAIKAGYELSLGSFYLFAGVKGGAVVSFYKAATIVDPKAGIVPFVSPEAGAGYRIADWIDVTLGAGFDTIIFANGDVQMNINPLAGANIRF